MNSMATVSEVLDDLKAKGYTVDFNLEENCLVCHSNALKIHPDEFVVDKHYRFEGMSDPDDEAIVYAISSTKHNIKGTLVDGYGISSDPVATDMIKALKEKTVESEASQQVLLVESKSNHATPLRPEGERELDATLVTMDLPLLKTQIKTESAYAIGDRNAITILKTDGMRIVMIALHKGAEIKTHKAPGIISVQVLEGHISFIAEGRVVERSAGQMLSLHAGIFHSVIAREESVFLLTIATKTKKTTA